MTDLGEKLGNLASFLLKALLVLSIARVGLYLLGFDFYIPVVDEFLNFCYTVAKRSVAALDRALGSRFGMGSIF